MEIPPHNDDDDSNINGGNNQTTESMNNLATNTTPVMIINDDPVVVESDDEVYVISDEDDDDVKLLEIRNDTNDLINNAQAAEHKITKKLNDVECPICFDEITKATATSCGHIFCLECIQKSVASSNARGQARGKRGVGLCPLCRKKVVFKDTVVMKMKVGRKVEPPVVG